MTGEVAQAQYTCQYEAARIDIGLRSVLCSRRRGLAHGSGRGGGRVVGSSRGSGGSSGRTDTSKVDRRLEGAGGCRGSDCGYRLNVRIRSEGSKTVTHRREHLPGVVAAAGGAKDREDDNAAGADDTAAGGAEAAGGAAEAAGGAAEATGGAAEAAGGATAALAVVV